VVPIHGQGEGDAQTCVPLQIVVLHAVSGRTPARVEGAVQPHPHPGTKAESHTSRRLAQKILRCKQLGLDVCFYLCTPMGRTVSRNQGVCFDHRPPDDPACPGPKEILMSGLGFQTEGANLLIDMLEAAPRVRKVQAMEARSNPDSLDPRPWVDPVSIECHEAYLLWEHQERIRLSSVWLFGQWDTAAQPEY